MPRENYLSRKSALLKDFYQAMAHARPILAARLGAESAADLISAAGREYEDLLPHIPYVGENRITLLFYIPTTQYLALYRVLQRHGWTVEEVGRLIYAIGTARLEALPGIARRLMRILWFSPWFLSYSRKMAPKSQQRPYPGMSVLEFVQGNGQAFDYGIDYVECSTCKFLAGQDALELAPYLCAIDKPASELLGWGLTRTMTLAEGSARCDFRFTKGGPTNVPLPQSLA